MFRNLMLITLILLAGFAIRIHDVATVPGGFSQEEITGIRIIETIRDGTIFVFFDVGNERGVESVYYALSVTLTRFMGDGLLGYRAVSLWVGLLTLALLYKTTRRLFGNAVGLVAVVAMSLSLWHTLLSRTVGHHVLLPFLVLAVVWAVTQAYHLRRRLYFFRPTTWAYTLLGVSVALVGYAHSTGFMAGIAVLIFGFQLGRSTKEPLAREIWWNSGYAVLMSLILGIPYFISVVRNWDISGPYIFIAERPSDLLSLAESIGQTLLAFVIRGDENPAHNLPGMPITQLMEPVLLFIGITVTFLRRHLPNYNLILIFVIVGLLPDMWVAGGPDYTLLGFMLPFTYMLIGIGAVEAIQIIRKQTYFPRRLQWAQGHNRLFANLTALVLVIGFSILAARNINFIFNVWPDRDDTRFTYNTSIGQVAHYLDTHADQADSMLICTGQFESVPVDAFRRPISDTQLLEWMLHKENLGYRVADCRTDLVLINGGLPMQIAFTDATELNVIATPLLPWFRLAAPRTDILTTDGYSSIWELNAPAEIARDLAAIEAIEKVYYPRDLSGNLEVADLPLDFDGNLSFIGFEPLTPQEFYRPGDVLTVTTYWRVDDVLKSDTGVFIRLHDIPQASPYTEINSFGVDTTRLKPGDLIIQVGYLTLPQRLRSHQYLLTLGVYEGLPVNQQQVYDETIPRGTYVLIDSPFQVRNTDEG